MSCCAFLCFMFTCVGSSIKKPVVNKKEIVEQTISNNTSQKRVIILKCIEFGICNDQSDRYVTERTHITNK